MSKRTLSTVPALYGCSVHEIELPIGWRLAAPLRLLAPRQGDWYLSTITRQPEVARATFQRWDVHLILQRISEAKTI